MMAGFFLVAGTSAIATHHERNCLCLIAPAAVLLGRAIAWWSCRPDLRFPVLAAALALGWLTLLGFGQHYFGFIESTGGASHRTFRTADVEPKQAALAEVLRQRRPGQVAWIATAEYWNEKPLAYLSAADEGVRVQNWLGVSESPELLAAAREGRVWFVEFAGSSHDREARAWLERQQVAYGETQIRDYAGQPILTILGPPPPAH
jgi:hypothetical protein